MYNQPPNSPLGIHGGLLEVTVIGCNKLKDMEWFSRQDPYACMEYGSTRNRTRVCTDGGKNPTFQEKFVYTLVEGLREINVILWNSNTITHDDFIGSGKVQLGKVLSQGFDDSSWPLHTKTGRHAGEVRLIMHYSNANANNSSNSNAATPSVSYCISSPPPVYPAPPPSSMFYPPTANGGYPTPFPYSSNPPSVYPPPPSVYPPHSTYPPQPYGSYYPHGSPYPAGGYPRPY